MTLGGTDWWTRDGPTDATISLSYTVVTSGSPSEVYTLPVMTYAGDCVTSHRSSTSYIMYDFFLNNGNNQNIVYHICQ